MMTNDMLILLYAKAVVLKYMKIIDLSRPDGPLFQWPNKDEWLIKMFGL